MRWIKGILALAVILAMVGCGMAATVTQMPGGTHSWSQGTGATAGWAHSFYEDTGLIQADIIAMATTTDNSDAWVKTEVPTEVSMGGQLRVGGKGTVEAFVDGYTGNNKRVTAVGQIHARADMLDSLNGEAWIYSGIGERWSKTFGDDDFQTGELTGATPQGAKFYGYANADGKAWYSGTDGDLIISGNVEGKTTLTGEAKGDSGRIGNWDLDGPAEAYISSGSHAEIDTSDMYDINSIIDNEISLRASNVNPCETDRSKAGPVSISGTATGKSNAYAAAKEIDYECNPDTGECDYDEYGIVTSAGKEDSMSADAYALDLQDDARAYANVWASGYASAPTGGDGVGSTAEVVSWLETSAEAKRLYPGSKPDGSDRTFGKAFITTGNWYAKSRVYEYEWHFDPTTYEKTETWTNFANAGLSGELSQVKDPTVANEYGMGAGAFLQNRKNGPAVADTWLEQHAEAEEGGHKSTWMHGYAYLAGPASPQWGSSGWDGSGIYKALKNLHVDADPDGTAFSTDLPTVEAYFWIDGTNDLMRNGPGYSVPVLPTFHPFGEYIPVYWTPFPTSSTERQAEVEMGTEQPW